MKKNVFGLISLCALSACLVSCSSDEFEGITPAKFGTKSSEVSLYLGKVKVEQGTRGCDVNGNMWEYMPEYPTEEEKAGVLAYIRQNPGATVAWPGYTCYYVQHVTAAHNKYSYTDWNHAVHSDIDGSNLDNLQVEEVRDWNSWEIEGNGNPYSWASKFLHVNNFNNGNCNNQATHNSALMTQGFNSARAWNSTGGNWCDDWALYYWNGNYYLGIDYKLNKQDGKIDPDGIYDDWIVKIIPGKGETPVVPTNPDEPVTPPTPSEPDQPVTPSEPDEPVTPSEPTETREAHVEFDIHQQEHKDWNEIKTSIHMRDTTAIHITLPIPVEYQAVADDFDIRGGEYYSYVEYINAEFTFAEKTYTFPVEIKHSEAGIEIFVDCSTDEAKEALKLARGVYDDGITFEVHSYIIPTATPDQIWGWLKDTKLPTTKTAQWPTDGDISTHVFGQVSSAYYMEEMIHFDERP